MTILINCPGKLLYRHENFQNTEAATEDFLKNFSFIGKRLCQSLFFNKVAGLGPATLKKGLRHKCFSVIFVKFLRTTFLQATVSQNMKAYV